MNIQDVYADATLLVTGSTGFLGKSLVEKILRTCTKVRKIIVLVRSRPNLTAEQQLDKLKKNGVFDRLRASNPTSLNKLQIVTGDISCSPKMGLSADDERMISDQVNFVFHSAAVVKFTLPFDVMANANILGTQRLLDLCRCMKNLKFVVYVSTAYTGVRSKTWKESLHATKIPMDMEKFLDVIRTGTAQEQLEAAHQYQNDHPNTYTFSKFFAEHLVGYYFEKYRLPVCIVRPSMISNAVAEPVPGWTSSYNGPVGMMIQAGLGTTRVIDVDARIQLDIVPVDYVSNLILVAPWWNLQERHSQLQIYNHTTNQLKPVYLSLMKTITMKFSRMYPSKYTMCYPNIWFSENQLVNLYNKWFYQMFFAYVFDLFLWLCGKKPAYVKNAQIFNQQMKITPFFRRTYFNFDNSNVLALIDASQQAADHKEFQMDFRLVKQDEYLKNIWLGLRRDMLKEDISVPHSESSKMIILYVIDRLFIAFQLAIGFGLIWIVMKVMNY